MSIVLHRNEITKTIPSGFSWTTFFFGFIPAAIRGQTGPAIIMLFTFWIGFISWIIYAFRLNDLYLEKLQGEGWLTTDQLERKREKEKYEKQEALNQQMMMIQALKN
jgi:hypothetical protein